MSPHQHVLVVDDDRDNREVIRESLQERFSVTLAPDGAQALELLFEHRKKFDLLIVDLEMPCLDGQELVNELRHCSFELPVLVISGAFDGRERASALDAEFMAKPFDLKRLNEKVERLISQRERRPSVDQGI